MADTEVSSSLKYYKEKLKPKRAVQLVGSINKPYHSDHILITNPIDYFVNQFSWGEMIKSLE